jgi:hypothetical protein
MAPVLLLLIGFFVLYIGTLDNSEFKKHYIYMAFGFLCAGCLLWYIVEPVQSVEQWIDSEVLKKLRKSPTLSSEEFLQEQTNLFIEKRRRDLQGQSDAGFKELNHKLDILIQELRDQRMEIKALTQELREQMVEIKSLTQEIRVQRFETKKDMEDLKQEIRSLYSRMDSQPSAALVSLSPKKKKKRSKKKGKGGDFSNTNL